MDPVAVRAEFAKLVEENGWEIARTVRVLEKALETEQAPDFSYMVANVIACLILMMDVMVSEEFSADILDKAHLGMTKPAKA